MKFSKSDRRLHQDNFNPPPNVYQPILPVEKQTVLTGSLASPALLNRNTFGYAPRFERSNKEMAPGPGSYNQEQSQFNSKAEQKRPIQGCFYPPSNAPSIPFCYYGQDADQEQKNYVKELLLSENVMESVNALRKKQPAYSFSKCTKSHSYIPQKKPVYDYQQTDEQNLNTEPRREAEELNGLPKKKNALIIQQKLKIANARRMDAINLISPDYVPSLQLVELIKRRREKANPGPGDYHQLDRQQNFPHLFENAKGVSFASVKRFQPDKITLLGPGLYDPVPLNSSNKYSFGRADRKVFETKDSSHYRFYINPEPLAEEEALKMSKIHKGVTSTNRFRSESCCPFGSKSTRFSSVSNQQLIDNSSTLEEQRKLKDRQNFNKMVKTRIKVQNRKIKAEKDEGLLALSTMASTIQ